jgi:hypothetical protein
MQRIILISCVSKKGGKKAKAKELYKGPLFLNSLSFAYKLKPDKIFILSALHHLLDLEKEIEPYNVTLSKIQNKKNKSPCKVLTNEEKIKWGEIAIKQLQLVSNIKNDEFIFLAGAEYIKPFEKIISNNNIKKPLKGLRLGERIKFMSNFKT